MNTKTKKIILATLSALAIFATGSLVGANGVNLYEQISQDAASTLNSAAKDKTDALTTDVQGTIKEKVKEKINPEIDQREAQIQAELDAYFNQKVNSLTNTQEYQNAIKDLDRIKGVYLDNYKAEIDRAFSGQ